MRQAFLNAGHQHAGALIVRVPGKPDAVRVFTLTKPPNMPQPTPAPSTPSRSKPRHDHL